MEEIKEDWGAETKKNSSGDLKYMHMGFILTKTPAEEGFQTFLKFINIYLEKEDLSIYLLGNGVYCVREGHVEAPKLRQILEKARIYVCQDDLLTRGIRKEQLILGVETFESYEDVVSVLMEDVEQILSF